MTLEAAPSRNVLRRLYDWCIDATHKPHAKWTMVGVSFAESSFFPVPPDVMLIPMALARPKQAYSLAAWCTAASVAGGVAGYAIGALLFDSFGRWVIDLYGYSGQVEYFREAYDQWGVLIIMIAGFTPFPYKVVTITSGFVHYNLALFIILSVVTRGARFFLLAFLLHRYGDYAREIIEKRLGLWVSIGAILLVGGIALAVYLI